VPRSRGGTRTILLCIECHKKAHHTDNNMTLGRLARPSRQLARLRGESIGMPPIGTKLGEDGRKLVEEPQEAAMLRRCTMLLRQGVSVRAVASMLTEEGFRTRRGGKINSTTVQRIKRQRPADVLTEPDLTAQGQALLPI
jgi:hypothetical protein